jgi:hypothetical protein
MKSAARCAWLAGGLDSPNLRVNVSHAQLGLPGTLRALPALFEPCGSRRDGVEVVLDAHDDRLRFTPSVNNEPFVLFFDPPDDLPELRPGREGGDDVWYS